MSRYKRLDVLCMMKQIGVIPVFYHADFEVAKNVICACADGGARLVEFTNRGDRAINIFTQLEEFCTTHKPDVVLGVGSIVDAPTAAMYIAAGANFVVGPCPWTDIMPTGGVSPTKESLTTWFEAGVACVGMGSNLITKELLDKKNYAGITKKVNQTIDLIGQIRGAN